MGLGCVRTGTDPRNFTWQLCTGSEVQGHSVNAVLLAFCAHYWQCLRGHLCPQLSDAFLTFVSKEEGGAGAGVLTVFRILEKLLDVLRCVLQMVTIRPYIQSPFFLL